VVRFVEFLVELPAEQWLALATAAPENHARWLAQETVRTLSMRPDIAVAIWTARDAVDTAAWYALPRTTIHALPLEAFRAAASALLLRALLTEEEFDALYAPFESVHPVAGRPLSDRTRLSLTR